MDCCRPFLLNHNRSGNFQDCAKFLLPGQRRNIEADEYFWSGIASLGKVHEENERNRNAK